MAAFIIMILLLAISDVTEGCLPKVLDGKVTVIKTPSSFGKVTAEAMKSFGKLYYEFVTIRKITMKKILNFTSSLTEEVKEANDTGKDFINKRTCNISDKTTPRIDEVKEKDGNIVEKCYMSKDCNEMWKRIFGKCKCQ